MKLTLVLLALMALPAAWAEGQGTPKPARHSVFADAEARYSHPPDHTTTASPTHQNGRTIIKQAPADAQKQDRRVPGMIGASKRWGRGVHAVPMIVSPTAMGRI